MLSEGECSVPPSASESEEELARILRSSQFGNAGRLSAFLEYIVRKTLAGQAHQIKEYAIGTEVFERPASFDPRLDTIVRVQASKLRSRLSEYYANTGADDPVIIDLPRGSYVPVFSPRPPRAHETQPGPVSRRRWYKSPVLPWAIAGLSCLWTFAFTVSQTIRSRGRAAVIRFTIHPPENSSFVSRPSLSPDGHMLLSPVQTATGNIVLWLRRLDSSSGQLLPGTEGVAFSASWSTDSRSILFVDSGGNLKRLDLSSAASPQLIGGTGPAWGADWNRDNVILVGQSDRGIVRTSPAGGAPSPVTHLDVSHQEIAHYWPRFLPNGRSFLYFARSKNPAEHAICAASLDGKVQKRLLVNPSLAQYVPAFDRSGGGSLLYVRGRALVAHRFNPDTLEITGDPRPIAEGVVHAPYGMSLFSASRNGVLAYRTDLGSIAQLAWFDRAGKPLGTVGVPGMYGDPVISPDGRRVAFDLIESSFNQDIWTIDLAGGNLSRLTFDPEVDHVPTWSPDGRRIVFDSHRRGQGDLYMKAATGPANEELLLNWKEFAGTLDWSRDGRFILFSSWSPDRRGDLWVLPLTGTRKPIPYLCTAADEPTGVFSPDGKWIAYVSNESGTPRIYVQGFDGVSPARGGKLQISIGEGSQPVWSANGRELYYLTSDYTLMAAEIRPGDTLETGARRALFATRLAHRGPRNDYAVSPDGLRFLLRVVAEKPGAAPIHLIVNWTN